MFQLLLSLVYGHSAPESGFPINNYLVGVHGHSLENNTIEALRFMKDSILRYPSLLGIPVGTEMLRSVKNAR